MKKPGRKARRRKTPKNNNVLVAKASDQCHELSTTRSQCSAREEVLNSTLPIIIPAEISVEVESTCDPTDYSSRQSARSTMYDRPASQGNSRFFSEPHSSHVSRGTTHGAATH